VRRNKENDMKFVPASIRDADLLFEWRNDYQTRIMSRYTGMIKREDHADWLIEVISDPMRHLLIATVDDEKIGTVRIDYEPETNCHELSWTIAPKARGKGFGKRMIAIIAHECRQQTDIKAVIKRINKPSIRIAENAGLKLEKATPDDFLHYFAPKYEMIMEKCDI